MVYYDSRFRCVVDDVPCSVGCPGAQQRGQTDRASKERRGGVAVVKQLQRFAIWQLRAGPLRNGDKVLYASVSRFGEWNWSWSGRRLSRRCGSDKATFLEDLPFA